MRHHRLGRTHALRGQFSLAFVRIFLSLKRGFNTLARGLHHRAKGWNRSVFERPLGFMCCINHLCDACSLGFGSGNWHLHRHNE